MAERDTDKYMTRRWDFEEWRIRMASLKIGHFVNEFSTLITWSLESSMETSMSMESRGYGLKGRTSFNRFRFTLKDTFTIIIMLVCFVMAVIPNSRKEACSILSPCNILYEIRCRRSAGSCRR